MNNKLTKEQLLTALMIKLDQIEYKIEKLLNVLDIPIASGEGLDRVITQRESIQDSEEFDGAYK